LSIRGKGEKYLDVKFKSSPININGKEAIIIWVDKSKFQTAIEEIKNS